MMNSYLNLISGKTKTASAEPQFQEIDLSKISGADLLAGLEDGSIVLPEQEKVAEEGLDLSELSEEQLLQLAEELGGQEKVASDEAESWDAAGRIFARGFMDEIDGGDGITGDMNIRDAMEKQATKAGMLGRIDQKAQNVGKWLLERATSTGRAHRGHVQASVELRKGLPVEGISDPIDRRDALRALGKKIGETRSSTAGRRAAGYGAVATGIGLTGAGTVGAVKGIQHLRNKKGK